MASLSADDEHRAHALMWLALCAGARVALAVPLDASNAPATAPAPSVVEHARWLTRGQQVEPVLLAGLRALGIPAQEARPHSRLVQLHTLRKTRTAVSSALESTGVPHMFIKGAALEGWLWGGKGWRGALDVDVVVEARHEHVARGVLHTLGYLQQVPRGRVASTHFGKERLFTAPPPWSPVDLHIRVLNRPFKEHTRALLQRRVVQPQPDGTRVPMPAGEDTLWLMAGNLAGDRFIPRIKLSLDAWALTQTQRLDWDAVVSRARAAGVDASLWALLRLVVVRLGGTVPPAVLAALRPIAPLAQWLETLAGVHGVPPRIRRRWQRVFLMDWPLSQQLGFPPHAVARWLALRAMDQVL